MEILTFFFFEKHSKKRTNLSSFISDFPHGSNGLREHLSQRCRLGKIDEMIVEPFLQHIHHAQLKKNKYKAMKYVY